ncbi:LCCL [Penicillium digitatum]|uniref:LCCL domain-containing protein n=3 Tax=Penicillium digitatum TaxID=36651 RepID=K9FZE7_PEND2|nr:hypothetical protein PDIP_51660 [Penicillium digitatum Pd1]EKV12786.1 hypothetical protein PDIP_51660 [Penicillium digitatum Pd1]EKV14494.1 hypothetical protein PDIG_32080 [Penicillium digitatum PHI26]KAG0155932.1 hypothetical protein PDIDSM_3105 [Penicillium digitatum]QQK43278.1 LCCL [Penicillium digitatum]
MQSLPESSGASARSPSPDNTPTSEYPLQEFGSRYRDEARDSDELSLDLEIGNVPLLPSGSHGMEDQSEKFERDPPFSCTPSGFCAWLRGPTPAHVYHINPWFPRLQAAPARLIDQKFPRRSSQIVLLFGGLIFWIVVFFASLKASVAGPDVPGYGQPVKLSCHDRLWSNATNCGLNGDLCRPFKNQSFAFRCPSGCAAAILLEPYVVGDQEFNYRPLVVGGKPSEVDSRNSGTYRGDSSICGSALHAGLIDHANGGCGILHRTGEQKDFHSIVQHGIESIEFLSSFPMSFQLSNEASSPDSKKIKLIKCSDARWSLFAFTLISTTILSLFVTSAPAFYSVTYFIVWFQVAMASDPPLVGSYYDLVSLALGRFLPGAFVGFVLYYFCVRHTLNNLDAHWDKTVLWLGGCWVGALNTDTFDRIPISRLTPHDIQQQPGALTALIIVVGSLIAIAFGQAHCFRREGRFFPTISIYGVLVAGVLILVAVPHMNLRIHHYILSLLFLPGTTMQTRPSLLYSGILIGLFINGIARWGFDSILQTPGALLDGAKLGTIPPKIYPPSLTDANNLVFSFPDLEPHADGLSVLVNDVERFQVFRSKDGQPLPDFPWSRTHPNELEYFRFGLVHSNPLGGFWYEDFSPPAVWGADGNFVFPDPEISEDPESESE